MKVVEVEVTYEVDAIPHRGTARQPVKVRETALVRMPEAAPSEIRLAVRAHLGAKGKGDPAGYERLWFLHEGRLLRRLANGTSDAFLPDHLRPSKSSPPPTLGEARFRQVFGSGREAALAQAQTAADASLFVDGEIHVPCKGPYLIYSPGYNSRSVSFNHASHPPSRVIGPEQDLQAIDASLRRRIYSSDVERLPEIARNAIEILVPGATLDTDYDAWALVETARRVFETELTNRMLNAYSPAHLQGWLRYRKPDFDRSTASEEMADLLRAVGESIGTVADGNSDTDRRLKELMTEAWAAAARWDLGRELVAAPAP